MTHLLHEQRQLLAGSNRGPVKVALASGTELLPLPSTVELLNAPGTRRRFRHGPRLAGLHGSTW